MAKKQTYPVSQEFIEEMYNSSDVCDAWKKRIKEEFPEAFESELVRFIDKDHTPCFKLGTSSSDPIYISLAHRPTGTKDVGTHLVLNEDKFEVCVERLADHYTGQTRLYVSFKPKK